MCNIEKLEMGLGIEASEANMLKPLLMCVVVITVVTLLLLLLTSSKEICTEAKRR